MLNIHLWEQHVICQNHSGMVFQIFVKKIEICSTLYKKVKGTSIFIILYIVDEK